jgi:hypothetical protein
MFIPQVNAANICDKTKYNDLRRKASKAKIEWEFKKDKDNTHYFIVTIDDVDEELIVINNNLVYEPKDGKITILDYFSGGKTHTIKFYGGYETSCVEEFVLSKNIKIPKYNTYSEMDECKDNKDFPLCAEWYDKEIKDEEDFYNQLKQYLKTDNKESKKKNNDDSLRPIIIVVIIILMILLLILLNNKKDKKNNNKGNSKRKKAKNE